MRVIGHGDVARVLSGREADIMSLVRDAYVCHDQGKSALPHSTFLRFNAGASDRIIALPGYLGGAAPAAGVKWIASFPGNLGAGLPRASGVVILNSVRTGQPTAVLEASLISAKRTAASAALAAVALRSAMALPSAAEPPRLAMIGCGVIAREVLGFLAASSPPVAARIYDTDRGRAAALARYGAGLLPGTGFLIADNARAAVADCDLVCFATTAGTPHFDAAACAPGTLVLHLSLRDITPASILACHNVVDDPDHACRENTSVHLAEQQAGNRDFIDISIGRLLADPSSFSPAEGKTVVYSPFGLGILDLALAELVARTADADGLGVCLDDFLPVPPPPATAARCGVAPRHEGATYVR